MEQLSPIDASFIYMDGNNQPMHISGLNIYDPSTIPADRLNENGVLSHKEILRTFEKTLPKIPAMRKRLIRVPADLDHPYWADDPDFSLEFHVRHIALPKPGDWRQLCIQVARLHARPLDTNRPLWEHYVIEGLDNIPGIPKGCFAIFSKIHHALVDGASGSDFIGATHTLRPEDPPYEVEDTWTPKPLPTTPEVLLKSYLDTVTNPMKLVESVSKVTKTITRFGQSIATGKYQRPPKKAVTRFSGGLSPNRVFDARVFPLKVIKQISKASNATVNDVLVTITSGAARKYLLGKGELLDDRLTAIIPMNIRSEAEKGANGNQVATLSSEIGCHIEDPIERLAFVHGAIQSQKEFTNALGAREIIDSIGTAPAALMSLGMRAAVMSGSSEMNALVPGNMTITNVPGPQIPLHFCGAKMVAMFGGGCILTGAGLFIILLSYNGMISMSVTSDRAMMPDPDVFADYLQESYDELVRATLGEDALVALDPNQTETAFEVPLAKLPRTQVAVKAKAAPKKKAVRKATAQKVAQKTAKKTAPKKSVAKKIATRKTTLKKVKAKKASPKKAAASKVATLKKKMNP